MNPPKDNKASVELLKYGFAGFLMELRKGREMDIPEFAELIGMDVEDYSRLETHKTTPPNKPGFIQYVLDSCYPMDNIPEENRPHVEKMRRSLEWAYDTALVARGILPMDFNKDVEHIRWTAGLLTTARSGPLKEKQQQPEKPLLWRPTNNGQIIL